MAGSYMSSKLGKRPKGKTSKGKTKPKKPSKGY